MQNVAVTPRVTPTVMVQQNVDAHSLAFGLRPAFAINDVLCQSGPVMDSGKCQQDRLQTLRKYRSGEAAAT